MGTRPGKRLQFAIENGPVEIVDLPSYTMVDLSIVICRFTRGGNPMGKSEPSWSMEFQDEAMKLVAKKLEFHSKF